MPELIVNEIFHSIQGESTHMGRPCVFVRLTYCNLRCQWCDTAYAFSEGSPMTIEAILHAVGAYYCPLVEVTGGEPLLQPGVHDLLRALCDKGYETLLETGGSLDIGGVDHRVKRIVDLKAPGSGMEPKNLLANLLALRSSDEVKFVIADRTDFDWACGIVRDNQLLSRCPVLFSPVFGILAPAALAAWVLESKLPVRMQVQMHKFIWDPARRGV